MRRSNALSTLLEELQAEGIHSDVEVFKHSKAILYPDDEAADEEDGVEFNANECRLLFASPTTVERLLDTLESAEGASLALFDVTVPGPVLELLECSLLAVDEG